MFSGIDWAEIALQVWSQLSPVVVAALGLGFAFLAQFTAAKVNNVAVQAVLLKLEALASVVVMDVQQTVVEATKARNADGKLTDGEKAEIKALATAKLLSFVNLAEIKKALGIGPMFIDPFLAGLVESAVLKMKAQLGL